ncbi:uncharacterized protein LOC130590159 [Beta vulgaris subsp. vulgaris]|uniref:uncharacterized protein LOC130590159 n=1 Tax=Beta vulgaris subsp. vulgaris TaxID=3555 RepID=UPI0025472807|nr:uncharacterized protein LOC130590159 [Beta vulgaris subsp. vulgaris]
MDWWAYEPPASASWGWKAICRVKNKFRNAYTGNRWQNGDKGYTIKAGYDWLQGQQLRVPWHYWVWNSLNIPKHSFIAWLAMLERLKTKERLFKSGVCTDKACLFCDVGEDSCLHIFFRCSYSATICDQILRWMNIKIAGYENMFTTWKKWGRIFRRKKLQKVSYAVLTALVYHIWKSRNHTLWNAAVQYPRCVVEHIQRDICSRIKSSVDIHCNIEDRNWINELVIRCS